jgi:predicted nucleotidyltransferase
VAAGFDLRLIVLFGSSARGRARQDSDLDVGVFAKHPLSATQRTDLWGRLSQLLQAEVDLTVLNHVEPLLGYQVNWKSYAVRRYWDTHKYRDALKDYLARRAEEMRRASA